MKLVSYHDCAVFGAAGDDQVVVRTPVDVQHRARVSAHRGVALVYAATLPDKWKLGSVLRFQTKDKEGYTVRVKVGSPVLCVESMN